jgi:hypothetical protein
VAEAWRGRYVVGAALLLAAEEAIAAAGHRRVRVMIDADATGAPPLLPESRLRDRAGRPGRRRRLDDEGAALTDTKPQPVGPRRTPLLHARWPGPGARAKPPPMTPTTTENGIAKALDGILNNRLVLLAGAGLSMAAPSNLPSAAKIAADAKVEFDGRYGGTRAPLPIGIEEQAELFFANGDLGVYLKEYVDQDAFAARPNAGHVAIADLLLSKGLQARRHDQRRHPGRGRGPPALRQGAHRLGRRGRRRPTRRSRPNAEDPRVLAAGPGQHRVGAQPDRSPPGRGAHREQRDLAKERPGRQGPADRRLLD